MCLSPEVDVIAAAAMAVVAVDALRHNREGRTLPLALLPALFSVHTFASALVWWADEGVVSAEVGEAAARFFMFVAFALLPIYLPVSVLLIEPRGWRRDVLFAFVGAGVVSGLDYLMPLMRGDATAVVCDYYIDFTVNSTMPAAGILYVIATVGAMLLSGHRPLMYWGIGNAVAVSVLAVWTQAGLPSLWCFWAACTSVFIAWFLRGWPCAPPASPREPEPQELVGSGG